MTTLVLASGNKGKLRELGDLFAPMNITVKPQSDFDVPEAEEPAVTFVENALLKARHAAAFTGLPALADDSGLEVAALGGMPGVRSARFAGETATDADNITKLLEALSGETDRRAAFVSMIVALRHADDPTPLIATGRWVGSIAMAPTGDGGFGYDPVFVVPDFGVTAAQLTPSDKQSISHRGRAMQLLLPQLQDWLTG
ncbi:MAG: RdgB/HAM1 family non-canonical purine NTP pyrophosphatase [Pseudomonadota bacterium]